MQVFQPSFEAKMASVKVLFGPGSRHDVGEEVDALGCSRAMVLSTPAQSDAALAIAETLGGQAVGVYSKAAMHTPVAVTEDALAHVKDAGADCVVAIGGGSTTGLGKAIAYRTDLPQVVIPTTYAGSEATPILGETADGAKTTLSDPKIQPEVIIYDAELVRSLPPDMTVTSALNAMAHAVEALYARDRNPVSSLLAMEGLKAFRDALPAVRENPDDLDARSQTLYGAWLCGTVLGQVGMALHHKLCHTLGGAFDLPHAQTHAVLLPHTAGYNCEAVPELLAPVSKLFSSTHAGVGLYEFAKTMDAPLALKAFGLAYDDLDKAAELATQNPYWNPRPVERDEILALLKRAWAGDPPIH